MALNLKYQTAAEFADRFWSKVKAAKKSNDVYTYHRLVWWIWKKIQDGDLTSDQVRLSYNKAYDKSLNTSQWNSLVTSKLIPMKDRYLAMLTEGDL